MTPSKPQRLIFDRQRGLLSEFLSDGSNHPIGMAYSGRAPHINDRGAENLKDQGPIIGGQYLVKRTIAPKLGPVVFSLAPLGTTKDRLEHYGRDGFLIHWDTASSDFTASTGCIVCVQPATFQRIQDGAELLVV